MEKSRLESLKEMLAKDPSDPFTRYALGLELVSAKMLDEAAGVYEELIISDPNYHAVYYQLGKVLKRSGMRIKPVKFMRKVYTLLLPKVNSTQERNLKVH